MDKEYTQQTTTVSTQFRLIAYNGHMPEPMLKTKFFVPSKRQPLVLRPRLVQQLNAGLQMGHKLTLVSAPAGFGKTTLVGEWIADLQLNEWGRANRQATGSKRLAWLSLDAGDNDLKRFMRYLVTAIRQAYDDNTTIGRTALAMLQSPQLPPVPTIFTSLLNELATAPDTLILVLDDYHLIDAQPVHDALEFFIENSPPAVHVAVATREDPGLPLARFRARAQLTELRAADLRFTLAEAAEFLNRVMGLDLAAADVAALEKRTEGWITGLQLAAISMQGIHDSADFIRSFTGSHRFVLDYLIEEVLEQQSDNVQAFLLQTAILKQLSGPLCDAVTNQTNGQETLAMLERANLFIIPLDGERGWYRYHHLFADLLKQILHRTSPDMMPDLHMRASKWYEQNNHLPDAIRHALDAHEFERAADLAEVAWEPMNLKYQAVAWLRWVKAIPVELVRSRPVLSVGCGWASLDAGDLEGAETHLRDAERWLAASQNSIDPTESSSGKRAQAQGSETESSIDGDIRALTASVANARAYLAQALGDVNGTIWYTQKALGFLRRQDHFERGLAEVLTGFAFWSSGNLNAAQKAIANAVISMQQEGRLLFVISFTSYLADIMVAQGRLNEARSTYMQLLEIATEADKPDIPERAVLHFGLCELCLQQGQSETAALHLQKGEALGQQYWFAPWYRHWIGARSSALLARGDLDGVIDILVSAERFFYRHPIPDIRSLDSMLARAWLAHGKLGEALRCVRRQGVTVDDELSYLREFEHITLARVLVARYQHGHDSINEAAELLARLLGAAEAGSRKGSVIEILVLQALVFEVQDEIHQALAAVERAIVLAEPEGYVRIFAAEGHPMARLLSKALQSGIAPNYVRHLLATCTTDSSFSAEKPSLQSANVALIEPLSERELEVLQLIADGLTNRQIAVQLFLTLNTVKVHTRNIYGKLDVHSRTQAVAAARELGLLPAG